MYQFLAYQLGSPTVHETIRLPVSASARGRLNGACFPELQRNVLRPRVNPLRNVHLAMRSITSQVLSAGLAEFNKKIEPAPMHVVQHLVHGAIRPEVGLNDGVECTLGSRDDWSRRYEPYPPEQSKELGQVRGVVFLVTQRVPVEARGLVNEFSIESLPLGLDRFMVRETKLRPLRQPRASKRCQSADCRSSKGGQR
jgi:hypothetical protein